MKARDKAKELVGKYINLLSGHIFNGSFDIAIQCALIAVDEIMQEMDNVMLPNPFKQYWEQVKQEISKL